MADGESETTSKLQSEVTMANGDDAQQGEAAAIAPTTEAASEDVSMTDAAAAPEAAESPAATTAPGAAAPATAPAAATTPAARNGTPQRNTTGGATQANTASNSRAASQHPPDTSSSSAGAMPAEATPHGAPVRQYLNNSVVRPLQDGMKKLARERPNEPLRVLGEYLLEQHRQREKSTPAHD